MRQIALLMAGLSMATTAGAQEASLPALSADEAAALFKTPTKITVKATDAPVNSVFETIMKQASQPTANAGLARNEKMSIDIKDMPFWEAATEFEKASRYAYFLGASSSDDEPHYSLVYATRSGGLKSVSGPLTAYLQDAIRIRTKTAVALFAEQGIKSPKDEVPGISHVLSIPMVICLDPAVPLINGSIQIGNVQAIDENGLDLQLGGGIRGGSRRVAFSIGGKPREGAGKKIASLKVEYKAFLAPEIQILTFDNIGAGPQSQAGQAGQDAEKYEIVETKQEPTGFKVDLQATRALNGMNLQAGRPIFKKVQIVDGTGKTWDGRIDYATEDHRAVKVPGLTRMKARIGFGRPGDIIPAPMKLIWTTPVRFQPFTATVEWRDVPLPEAPAAE